MVLLNLLLKRSKVILIAIAGSLLLSSCAVMTSDGFIYVEPPSITVPGFYINHRPYSGYCPRYYRRHW